MELHDDFALGLDLFFWGGGVWGGGGVGVWGGGGGVGGPEQAAKFAVCFWT